jgi:dUTP pyrophosphatase
MENEFICRICGCKHYTPNLPYVPDYYWCNDCRVIFKDLKQWSLPIIKFYKKEGAITPTKAYPEDTGFDLYSMDNITISPLETEMVSTGIFIIFPKSYGAEIRPKSGKAYKLGLTITNSPATIDNKYRNEIKVLLYNSNEIGGIDIKKGDKIGQLVLEKVLPFKLQEVEQKELFQDITNNDRGEKGFGSSGD